MTPTDQDRDWLTRASEQLRARWPRLERGFRFVEWLAGQVWRWSCRHPGPALIGLAILVLVGPLIPDLFYVIPWPWRKRLGWVAFAGLAALGFARLVQVGTTDRDEPPASLPFRAGPWLGWGLLGVCVLLGIPLLRHPENLGFGDWDLFLGKLEGARRTIVLYGQFPWWDPWTRGGFPLAANPQCGVAGVAMPLTLLFGTTVGMRLATVVGFALATEGARRLARLWLGDPWASAAAGLIYGLNGGVMVAAVAAYHVTMCYPVLPWMLYCLFQLERRPRFGVGLGFWMAYNVLNGIQYFTVYQALIGTVFWVRLFCVRSGQARLRLLTHTALALGVFLGLAGWRIATTGLVMSDFPREIPSGLAETPWKMLIHLLNRPSMARASDAPPYFWETTCYVGPIVLALAGVSLLWGWSWWHWLAFLCLWLAMGGSHWHDPSYWLSHFPLFATMHVVTRWRFMAVLGLALAAASVLARWRASDRLALRWLAVLTVLAIGLDYLSYGFHALPIAFSIPPAVAGYPGPPLPSGQIVQIRQAPGFASIVRGYGVIHGFEPLMGYDRAASTARLWRGQPAYVGEHWTALGPVEPVSWTPNRIVLQVAPREPVHINQNPGSWWYANGVPAFPRTRCAEKDRAFVLPADDHGRLTLEIRPRGLGVGGFLHILGAALAIGALLTARRLAPAPGCLEPG